LLGSGQQVFSFHLWLSGIAHALSDAAKRCEYYGIMVLGMQAVNGAALNKTVDYSIAVFPGCICS
jgi:hypothetical protein